MHTRELSAAAWEFSALSCSLHTLNHSPALALFPLPRMFLCSNTLLQQDNFSSLKCRSTLLEYIRVQNPSAGLSPHYYFDLTSSETESERAWSWAESSVQSHVIRTNSTHSPDLRLAFWNLHFAVHRFFFLSFYNAGTVRAALLRNSAAY